MTAFACGSFGEGSDPPASPPPDGGTGDSAGPTNASTFEDETVAPTKENTSPGSNGTFCAQKITTTPTLVFCSDFDDPIDEWVGWDRPDIASRYSLDTVERTSPLNAGRVQITGNAGESPDARLRHVLPKASRFALVGRVRFASPTKPMTDAAVLKIQFAKGQLIMRSTGRVVEVIPSSSGGAADFPTRLEAADVPLEQWLQFGVEIDLPTGNFSVSVNGFKRSATMSTPRAAESVLLLLGAMDPSPAVAPDLSVWLDDVFVTSEP
jgi:hypothetical protein